MWIVTNYRHVLSGYIIVAIVVYIKRTKVKDALVIIKVKSLYTFIPWASVVVVVGVSLLALSPAEKINKSQLINNYNQFI